MVLMQVLYLVVAFIIILVFASSLADFFSTLGNGLNKQISGSPDAGLGESYPSRGLKYGITLGTGIIVFVLLLKIASSLREEERVVVEQ